MSSVYPPLCWGTEEQTKTCWHLITNTLDIRKRTGRDKEADSWERGVLWIYMYVCTWGFYMEKAGVKAWKKVPIVQLGVMREVIRVWVSRAGPQLGLKRVTEPVEAVGQRGWQRGISITFKTTALWIWKDLIFWMCVFFISFFLQCNRRNPLKYNNECLRQKYSLCTLAFFLSCALLLFTTWGRQTTPVQHQFSFQFPSKLWKRDGEALLGQNLSQQWWYICELQLKSSCLCLILQEVKEGPERHVKANVMQMCHVCRSWCTAATHIHPHAPTQTYGQMFCVHFYCHTEQRLPVPFNS